MSAVCARMVESVDTTDLKSVDFGRASSSLAAGTILSFYTNKKMKRFFSIKLLSLAVVGALLVSDNLDASHRRRHPSSVHYSELGVPIVRLPSWLRDHDDVGLAAFLAGTHDVHPPLPHRSFGEMIEHLSDEIKDNYGPDNPFDPKVHIDTDQFPRSPDGEVLGYGLTLLEDEGTTVLAVEFNINGRTVSLYGLSGSYDPEKAKLHIFAWLSQTGALFMKRVPFRSF